MRAQGRQDRQPLPWASRHRGAPLHDLPQARHPRARPDGQLHIARLAAGEGDLGFEADGQRGPSHRAHHRLVDGLLRRGEGLQVPPDVVLQIGGGGQADAEVDHFGLQGDAGGVVRGEVAGGDAGGGSFLRQRDRDVSGVGDWTSIRRERESKRMIVE